VRESIRTLEIHYSSKGRLLVSPDLGLLLGRCSRVALREGTEPVVLAVDRLIQWRALQVVTATPFLPGPERLSAILRGAHLDPTGFRIPLGTCSPEEVLAECVAHGIEVAGSRIIYWLPPTPPRAAALDRVPLAQLGAGSPAASADFPPPHPLRSACGTQPSPLAAPPLLNGLSRGGAGVTGMGSRAGSQGVG
jgi:hypothetical protein